MFCKNCGSQINPGMAFCTSCGHKVEAEQQVPVMQMQSAPEVVQNIPNPVVNNQVMNVAPIQNGTQTVEVPAQFNSVINGRTIRKRYANRLWKKGCPIAITECIIADRDYEGNLGLYLEVENLDTTVIEGIFFDVKGYTLRKEEKCNLEDIAVIDIRIAPAGKIIIPVVVELPDNMIRQVKISVRNVVFEDETIWTGDVKEPLTSIKYEQEKIPTKYIADLSSITKKVTSNEYDSRRYPFYPVSEEEFWVCACGQFNKNLKCVLCGEDKNVIMDNISEAAIKKEADSRGEREKKAIEEAIKAQEEQERKRLEEAKRREEEERRRKEEARLKYEEEQRKAEEERQKAEAEMKKAAEEQKKAEAESKKAEEVNSVDNKTAAPSINGDETSRAESIQVGAPVADDKLPGKVIDVFDETLPISKMVHRPASGMGSEPTQNSNMIKPNPASGICKTCGANLIPGDLFCVNCGTRV